MTNCSGVGSDIPVVKVGSHSQAFSNVKAEAAVEGAGIAGVEAATLHSKYAGKKARAELGGGRSS